MGLMVVRGCRSTRRDPSLNRMLTSQWGFWQVSFIPCKMGVISRCARFCRWIWESLSILLVKKSEIISYTIIDSVPAVQWKIRWIRTLPPGGRVQLMPQETTKNPHVWEDRDWKTQVHVCLPSNIKWSKQLPSQETLTSHSAERRNSWTASHEESPRIAAFTSAVLGWASQWCSCFLMLHQDPEQSYVS